MAHLKTLLTSLMLFSVVIAFGKTKSVNDTIAISQKEVRWISQPYTKTNGEQGIHYYGVWKGNLLTTSKTVIEKTALCEKYGASCALIVIGKKQNGTFKPKRIAID